MLDEGVGLDRRAPVRRTAEERAAIVAETYLPGATVAGVARKHGIVASQLSSWRTVARRKAERGKNVGFAEVAVAADVPAPAFDGIEIMSGSVMVRLPKSTPMKRIVEITRGLARP